MWRSVLDGWIDSKKIKIDEESSLQFFSRRKPNSTWSKINKTKVQRLIEEGLMTDAGIDSVERAKQNGSWIILDEVEELIVPKDLEIQFEDKPNAKEYFSNLSKSNRKAILQWLVLAKRPETRLKRIMEVVALAEQNRSRNIYNRV
ncbi:MAG TPA: YdeI/OmpD-associated family protein [Aequorivita sp.]|nr:YdeI/OmpD-associated family protein [Aequorivita sp.]